MKNMCGMMLVLLLTVPAVFGASPKPVEVSDLSLEGEIEGENIVFTLTFTADVTSRKAVMPLVIGDAAYLDGKLPKKSELVRSGSQYILKFARARKESITFRFASRAVKDGDWRQTSFAIPAASVRKLSVICDRDDLELQFPGALDVKREKIQRPQDGGKKTDSKQEQKTKEVTRVTAFLGVTSTFEVRWKPEVKKLAGELVVTCDANTIALASVGALKIDNLFTYRVVQGSLKELYLALPDNLNITQVRGGDIQDWVIEERDDKPRLLTVTLSRPKETLYKLQVESEIVLPEFPCELDLPVITPQKVIRSSGFLMFGTDSAIKLLVDKELGLTQVDQTSFPALSLESDIAIQRVLPSRSKFAYQYANMPYTLNLSADDIVPEYSSSEQLVLSVKDSDLVLSGSIELDVRDAPAREILIETDLKWIVANVAGTALSDYDVRDIDGKRVIYVYFRDAVIGRTLIDVRLEQSMSEDQSSFTAPAFSVRGAKSERGHLVLAAEKGLRLKQEKIDGLREVQTGSVETRVPGAQLAYRFKEGDWTLSILLERTKPTIYSETFNLISIGEGVLYCSSIVTYHIEGAPVRAFKMVIPEQFQNVEFTGRDVRGWTHDGEIWTVSLQEKVMGDYTLGLTYDKRRADEREDIFVGGVKTIETTSESGYIVLASSASLNLTIKQKDESIIRIDHNEIPKGYALLVNDPVLEAFKFMKVPHTAQIRVERYDTEQLLSQVVDHTSVTTEISKDGEAVTKAIYAIKNLSMQYFVVFLPEGARLWSTALIDQQGERENVTSMQEEGATLIPIHRLRDPNMPVQVELIYAQSHKKLGAFGRTLEFAGPRTPDTHSTFAKWSFSIPDGFSVSGISGNMTPDSVPWVRGIATVFVDLFRLCGVTVNYFTGWLLFLAVGVISVSILAYYRGMERSLIWRTLVCVTLLVVLFGVVVAVQHHRTAKGVHKVVQVILHHDEEPGDISVTKTVSLAANDPLTVKLHVVPAWIGTRSSLLSAIIALALGIWLTSKALGAQTKSPTFTSLGFTVLTLGFAELASGRLALMILFGFGIPIVAATVLIRWSYNQGRKKLLAAGMWEDIDPPAPFEENPPAGGPDEGHLPSSPVGGYGEPRGTDDGEDKKTSILDVAREKLGKGPLADSDEGRATIFCLLSIAFLGLCLTGNLSKASKVKIQMPELPVMTSVLMTIDAPEMKEEGEKSARVKAVLEFETEKPGSFILLRSPSVLTKYKLNSRHLTVGTGPDGYQLTVDKAGVYEVELNYSVPIIERNGAWFMGLGIPSNLKNKVVLRIPEKELDIDSPDAVLLKTTEKDGVTEAMAVYGSATQAHISWRARARKTKLEKVVFFCEVNTLAIFEPGVVDLANLIRYQIAQGELKSMTVMIPGGMSVTAVKAQGLSTWRFDPQTRLLEAILEKPVSGDFMLQVITQVSCEGLPYDAAIGTIEVRDAVRQRGSIAFSVPDTVQVQVDKIEGLNPMNIEDVSPMVIAASRRGSHAGHRTAIKRAFRYHDLPVSATVQAKRVLPELRVVESASLSVADERLVLSTQLSMDISKAGIFSLYLGIPDGFDVETLTGQDISHWDEVGPEIRGQGLEVKESGNVERSAEKRGVIVHFRTQALGNRRINLVVARTEKGLEKTISVPRITVSNVMKHSGSMVVSGERGVRMTTVEKEGVSEMNPRDLGIRQIGVLAFKLLRPEWFITLKAEVVAPTIRSETLQRVDLSEGMLQCTSYVRYRIENAGSKIFRIKSPASGVSLAVTGRDISKVHEIDKEKGIWEVELHNKVENMYSMEVRYQVPFDTATKSAAILPVKTLEVESQKGYLVVMSGGRVQVKPMGSQSGLKVEDSRSIPATFGAGDLSDAILCYRTVSGEYELGLSVVRHKSADVLPARVKSVRMISVVSDDGQVLTRVVMDMTVGNLSFLEMTLPDKDSTLWTAFVKGKAASVSREGNMYRIPLEEPVPGESTTVELIYASAPSSGWFSRRQEYRGPRFDLPLKDIEWTFYVVPGRRYYGFGGTVEYQKEPILVKSFNMESYASYNQRRIEENRAKAKQVMAQSEQLARQGKQQQAKRALESAVNYSQNDMVFNEDARIQYKNLAEQQAVVGLVQRRDEMRFARNIQDVGQIERMREFKGGKFTADYATKIQQSLSDSVNVSLRRISENTMEQQVAAERVAQAITIDIPVHGLQLMFHRRLQINPEADMVVSYKVSSGAAVRWILVFFAAVVLMVVYWYALAVLRKLSANP